MNWVLRLYPGEFRDRYGEEVSALLESSPTPKRDLLNVVWHALLERTEYAMALGWRRLPRYSGYFVLWLAAAYVFGAVQEKVTQTIIQMFLAPHPVPVLRTDIDQMRAATLVCVAAVACAAFFLGRRYWRGTAESVVVALGLASAVGSVMRVDIFSLYSIQVSWHWDLLGLLFVETALWLAGAGALVWVLRRVRRPGLVAIFGVVALAYATSVAMTALLDQASWLQGNPWTDYWQSIMGGFVVVVTEDNTAVGVRIGGWWVTVAAALVAGCTVAARHAPKTAQSAELVS